MRRVLTGLQVAVMAACAPAAPDPAADEEIRSMLEASAVGWNAGNLDVFMASYARESRTTFVGNHELLRGWDAIRTNYAALFEPGAMRDSLRFEDIEIRLPNMRFGSIKHGDYSPVQLGCFRPNQECSSTKTPIDGLYVCGASTYPGGLVIGGPGYPQFAGLGDPPPVLFALGLAGDQHPGPLNPAVKRRGAAGIQAGREGHAPDPGRQAPAACGGCGSMSAAGHREQLRISDWRASPRPSPSAIPAGRDARRGPLPLPR